MIDRQLPGEAAMSNQSRSRSSCPIRQLPQARSPSHPPLDKQRGILTRVRGSQTMIVQDPRVLWSTTPLAFCHAGGSSLALAPGWVL